MYLIVLFHVQDFSFNSKNPVLHKITEHLIEEASTEEEELLGLEASESSEQADPELMRVLDRLVLYLRIVHSVDYYNHCEYPYEDEMPNRCGIMHARSGPPPNKVRQLKFFLSFIIYKKTLYNLVVCVVYKLQDQWYATEKKTEVGVAGLLYQ